MHPFWDTVLRPILTLLRPDTIVEIGVENGKTTEKLLAFCTETGAALHGIDPLPLIDEQKWKEQWGETWTLHTGKSLDVLPHVPGFDALLIDGDHNWYTVFHELQLMQRHAEQHDRMPIVFLHDIDAPYGRRDRYDDPKSIPADARQPWERSDINGLNPTVCHAVREGGPHNGVRTAVEDFLLERSDRYAFFEIRGFFGLGILVPYARFARHPSLRNLLTDLSPSALLQAHMEQLEQDRMLRIPCADHLDRSLREQHALREECDTLAGTIEQLLAEQARYVESMHALEHLTQTRSWRWTAWLRHIGAFVTRHS